MAKKNTTLQDLSKFLNQETTQKAAKTVKSVEEFISKEPVRLAKVSKTNEPKPAVRSITKKTTTTPVKEKTLSNEVKPTIPAIKVAIETYANEHNLSEQEVYYKLNPLVNEKVSTFNPLESYFKIQQQYVELWLQFNRTFFKL